MNLDEASRRRFRALLDDTPSELAPEAVDRIVAATLREAERARFRRRAAIGAVAVFASAAGVAWFVRAPTSDHVAHPDAHDGGARHAVTACAAYEAASTQPVRLTSSVERLDLSRLARMDVLESSRFGVAAESSCATDVTLEQGTVSVWARDLGGGEFSVRTPSAEVVVRGTVFQVRANDDGSSYVAVTEGLVEVRHAAGTTMVRPGQALRVAARDTAGVQAPSGAVTPASAPSTSTTLETPDAASVRALEAVRHGDAPASRATLAQIDLDAAPYDSDTDADTGTDGAAGAHDAAPVSAEQEEHGTRASAAALLRAADTAFREGRLDEARRAFQQVGASRGATAEAALIRLGRLELRAGRSTAGLAALAAHRRRFPNGALAAEARMAEAQALRAAGRAAEAARLEAWIVAQRPTSPQAASIRERR